MQKENTSGKLVSQYFGENYLYELIRKLRIQYLMYIIYGGKMMKNLIKDMYMRALYFKYNLYAENTHIYISSQDFFEFQICTFNCLFDIFN